jgi:hypothetical protein
MPPISSEMTSARVRPFAFLLYFLNLLCLLYFLSFIQDFPL